MSETPSTRISSLQVARVANEQMLDTAKLLEAVSQRLVYLSTGMAVDIEGESYDRQGVKRANGSVTDMLEHLDIASKGSRVCVNSWMPTR